MHLEHKVKFVFVKLSNHRPGQFLGLQDVEALGIATQSAHKGGKLVSVQTFSVLGVKLLHLSFLFSQLIGVKYSTLRLDRFNPGEITLSTRCIGYGMKSRALLDSWRREKSPAPTGIRTTFFLSASRSLVTIQTTPFVEVYYGLQTCQDLPRNSQTVTHNYAQKSQNDPFESC